MRADEAVASEVGALHASTPVKSGKLVGEGRLAQFCVPDPILIGKSITADITAVSALGFAQYALPGEMNHEFTLQHR